MEKYELKLENKQGDWKILDTKGRIPSQGEIIHFYIDDKYFSKLRHLNNTINYKDAIEDFNRRFNGRIYEIKKIESKSKFCGKNLDFKMSEVSAKEI